MSLETVVAERVNRALAGAPATIAAARLVVLVQMLARELERCAGRGAVLRVLDSWETGGV